MLRGLIIATTALGASMCATTPEPEEPEAMTGPDGLIIRSAPTDAVEAGALPAPSEDGENE